MAISKISYEDWTNDFKPIYADGEDQLLQTPLDEKNRAFIQSVEPNKIWTYGSGEYGGTYIWSGPSSYGSDTIGLYVTEVGHDGADVLEIEVFEPEFTCPGCEKEWTGDEAVAQQMKYEEACEDCGTEDDLL